MQTNKQHIVVLKGYEGFADRLQVLSHCIHYCILNNALLCVDWRDSMWGQEALDFSDYFDIIGVNTISLNDTVEYLINGASIIPNTITAELLQDIPDRIHTQQYALPDSILRNNCNKINSDIVVFNSIGFRLYHIYTLTGHLRLKDTMIATITSRLSNITFPFSMIHLRGTDRLGTKSIEEIVKQYDEKYKKSPPHSKINLYVVSDSKYLADKWIEMHPDSKLLQENSSVFKLESAGLTTGTHKQMQYILDYYGVNKHELNIDTLTEFIALSFAIHVIGNEESLYYKMSRFIHEGGIFNSINKWLNNWRPPFKSIK
jgi:hypothetical protein